MHCIICNSLTDNLICKECTKEKGIFERIKESEQYKEGFNILMDYWDSLPDEEKGNIDKKLREIGLWEKQQLYLLYLYL